MAGDETQTIDFTCFAPETGSVFDAARRGNRFKRSTDADFINHMELRIAAALAIYEENPARAFLAAQVAYGSHTLPGDYTPYFDMCRSGEMHPQDFYARLAERAQPILTPGWRKPTSRSSMRAPGE